jgi:hypothetical protein
MSAMSTTALAPWFGGNRILAHQAGRQLGRCKWVGVPFAGGMSEIPHIQARCLAINDLHRHVINLARVIQDPKLGPVFRRRVAHLVCHPDVLDAAQERCRLREAAQATGLFAAAPDPALFDRLDWAVDYFVCAWMSRSNVVGSRYEFAGGLPVRWNTNGGDSATRYRSAVRSIVAWRREFTRDGVNFTTLDAFEFLESCKDEDGHGIYSDAPWPRTAEAEKGDRYTNVFPEAKQRQLAKRLGAFRRARVVVRYGDHPLIREIYPPSRWNVIELAGRDQANKTANELLIVNGPVYTEDDAA